MAEAERSGDLRHWAAPAQASQQHGRAFRESAQEQRLRRLDRLQTDVGGG